MAVKKKAKKKAGKKPRRRGGARRGLVMLAVIAGVVAALVIAGQLMKPQPERILKAMVTARIASKGLAPGQLDSPRGISLDPQGNLYVTDLGNARINKYGPDGSFLLSIGKRGDDQAKNRPGEFREPSGVAVDRDGMIYVADAWNGRIQKFDAKGAFMEEFGGVRYSFYSPRNVAVDAKGNFYVADTGNSALKAYNSTGKLLKELGGRGKGSGRFNEIFGLAINSKGEVFAADPGNRRITKFSALPEGKFLKDKKVRGWEESAPFWPHLAVDAADRVFASDTNNRKVWVYDSQLNYLGTLALSEGKELFGAPVGLAAGQDALFVADRDANRVLRLEQLEIPAAP